MIDGGWKLTVTEREVKREGNCYCHYYLKPSIVVIKTLKKNINFLNPKWEKVK